MQAPLRKKSEMKLFILYIMSKIGYPMDFQTLNDVCCIDGIISSFDFCECFSELLTAGNIYSKTNGTTEVFFLTDHGVHIVNELYDMLIPSLRETAIKSALRLISFKKSGYRIEQSVNINPKNGKRQLTVAIKDDDGVRFSITMEVESERDIDKMQLNFERRPEDIYKRIYAMLAGNADFLFD